MAEWLRRLTRNQIPSGSVGSNPTGCGHFTSFFSMVLIEKISIFGLSRDLNPGPPAPKAGIIPLDH